MTTIFEILCGLVILAATTMAEGFMAILESILFLLPWAIIIWVACYFCGCSAPKQEGPKPTLTYEVPAQFVMTPTKSNPEWPAPSKGCQKFKVRVRETVVGNHFSLSDPIDYRNLNSAIKDCSQHDECLTTLIKWGPLKYAITCSVRKN